ncbi:MFS transporter [Streptomyces nigra]|uniref:MFS transporter n=1 Tax=Streptomyces nigra TaxID=1827580 RepID=UPI003412DA51
MPGGCATTATAPRRVVGSSAYIQYADGPPPCDAPHPTPRADPPGITGPPFLYLQQRGFSAGQVAVLQTLIYLVSGLAELPTGVITDRVGRRAGIVIGQVLIAVCLLGQAASSQYWVFVVLFIGHGAGMACVSGSDSALLYDLLVRRGATAGYVRIWSRFTMVGTVTSGVAIVLGGRLQRFSCCGFRFCRVARRRPLRPSAELDRPALSRARFPGR